MYDYNKPIQENEFDFIEYYDNGKSKVLKFKYDGKFFEQRYNYTSTYGFKFITQYDNETAMNHSLSTLGEKMIYSTTLQSDCTELGKYIEYSLIKLGLPNIINITKQNLKNEN